MRAGGGCGCKQVAARMGTGGGAEYEQAAKFMRILSLDR